MNGQKYMKDVSIKDDIFLPSRFFLDLDFILSVRQKHKKQVYLENDSL